MKKNLLFVFLLSAFANLANAQMYTFSQRTNTYTEISGGTVLSTGDWYHSDHFSIALPFTFNFYGQNFTTLHILAHGFAGFNYSNEGGITDVRGYEMYVHDTEHMGAANLSPISYAIAGSVGNRIVKVQWKNALFEEDEDELDYANFQLWLYENGGKVEFHYGPISVVHPDSYEMPNGGPTAAILNENGSDRVILTGNPANPTVNDPTATFPFLTGSPTNGTVYVFTRNAATNTLSAQDEAKISVYPNPFKDNISISAQAGITMEEVKIYSNDGRMVCASTKDLNQISTEELLPGIYVVEIVTTKGSIRRKLVK